MIWSHIKGWSRESQISAVNIRRGIFQSDSISPSVLVVALLPITVIIRKMKKGHSFGKGKINHLLFMGDLKLRGCNGNETHVSTTQLHTDICQWPCGRKVGNATLFIQCEIFWRYWLFFQSRRLFYRGHAKFGKSTARFSQTFIKTLIVLRVSKQAYLENILYVSFI